MHHLDSFQVAYVGDDLIDLGIMKNCGLSAAPSDAPVYVQDHANIVCKGKGGEGVVREVADLILASQGKLENVVSTYLKELSI